MLEAVKRLFRTAPDPRVGVSPGIALAALMVEAARADGDYAEAERAVVTAMLVDLLAVSNAEALALRTAGEAAQAVAPDLVRFTRVVKDTLDEAQRLAVIEALWRVVLADGRREVHEDALMRHLAPLLAVSDRDSARARQRVLAAG